MLRLPISGLEVFLRSPTGEDDLAILENPGGNLEKSAWSLNTAHTILTRLARISGPDNMNHSWLNMTVTDFEFALLALRAYLFGDTMGCTFFCSGEGCGERMELDFSIAEFTAGVLPSTPMNVVPVFGSPGWFKLAGTSTLFRLPTAADQQAVLGRPGAETALAARCIDPPKGGSRGRIERAMSALAPEVSRSISGQCPGCGVSLSMPFYVPQLVAEEVRRSAVGVHDDIHAIAYAYHWPEAAILAMPRARRQSYTERIRLKSRGVN